MGVTAMIRQRIPIARNDGHLRSSEAGGGTRHGSNHMKKRTPHPVQRPLDPVDCELIRLLQQDGRIPNTVLAKKIGISEATVRTRLNRLIQDEVIQIVAVSNPMKLGFEIVGIIRIHVDIHKIDHITKELKKLEALWFIVHTTGGTGIDAEFVVKDIQELNALIFEKINRIDGVNQTETSLILKYVKRNYHWGTALD